MTSSMKAEMGGADALPIGAIVEGLFEGNPDYINASYNQILQKVDYPVLADTVGELPLMETIDQIVPMFGATEVIDITSNGTNTFLALSTSGQIARSTDTGVNWTIVNSIPAMISINYAGALVFGTMSDGSIAYSTDNGAGWALCTLSGASFASSNMPGKVKVAANGYVFTRKNGGQLFYSSNGSTFNVVFSPAGLGDTSDIIVKNNGVEYLSVMSTFGGYNTYSLVRIPYSGSVFGTPEFYNASGSIPVGSTYRWPSRLTYGSFPSPLEFINNRYVAYGYFQEFMGGTGAVNSNGNYFGYSSDGVNWSLGGGGNGEPYTDLKFTLAAGRLVACILSSIRHTTDGINWTSVTNPFSSLGNGQANNIAYGSSSSSWIVAGPSSRVAVAPAALTGFGTLITIAFAATVSLPISGMSQHSNGTIFIGGEDGVAAKSPNGDNWTAVSIGSVNDITETYCTEDRWFAATGARLHTSTDLVAFVECTFNGGATLSGQCTGLVKGNGVWVAVTASAPYVYYSTNGVNFVSATTIGALTGASSPGRIQFAKSFFTIFNGNTGEFWQSADGNTWINVGTCGIVVQSFYYVEDTDTYVIFSSGSNGNIIHTKDFVNYAYYGYPLLERAIATGVAPYPYEQDNAVTSLRQLGKWLVLFNSNNPSNPFFSLDGKNWDAVSTMKHGQGEIMGSNPRLVGNEDRFYSITRTNSTIKKHRLFAFERESEFFLPRQMMNVTSPAKPYYKAR